MGTLGAVRGWQECCYFSGQYLGSKSVPHFRLRGSLGAAAGSSTLGWLAFPTPRGVCPPADRHPDGRASRGPAAPRSDWPALRDTGRAGPRVYWGLHTRTHSVTQRHGYSVHTSWPPPTAGPRGSGVQSPPQWPRPSWGLPPGLGRAGAGRPRPGEGGEQGAGAGPEGLATLTPGTGASATVSAPSSGWSRGSRRPGTSRPRLCKPCRN